MALALAGCPTAPVDDDDDSTEDGSEDETRPVICAAVAPSVSNDPDGGFLVETEHYRLHLRGVGDDEAEELGRIAETAWDAWQAYFSQGFDVDAPLEAYVEGDYNAFAQRLITDGLDPDDASGAGGYYHPSTRRAYLYAQPSVWFTRVLFLHELAHQAHGEARDSGDVPGWYVEGVAEFVSRHDWDGTCLRLGVTPHLSLEDPAAAAASDVPGVSLAEWFDDGAWPGRPLAMEFLRLVHTSPDLAPGWDALRTTIDADGSVSSDEVEEVFGISIEQLEQRLVAFVPTDQEPMIPVYLEWLHRTPQSVRGWADGVITVSRHKNPPAEISLVSEGPSTGGVGLLLSWDSGSDYDALVLKPDGALWSFNAVGGTNTWSSAGSVGAPGTSVAWTLRHEDAEAVVTVDGVEVRVPTHATPSAGLAVENDDVIFTELSWRP
ncbi:MAG: hypothetical protein KDA24_22595 [Deltaproteobacteria bacterium]|nr:hypothetical protein [Deltaproteobacteria bacterium]